MDEAPKVAPEHVTPAAILQVVLTQEGRVLVNGSIENKMLAYGMLEMAKDALRAFHEAKANPPKIVIPKSTLPTIPFPRNGKG